MDPVSQFKFACPVCGQHLQARAEEAGETTECPSCFKELTVPQAPTNGGGKLLITAALADGRRSSASRRPRRGSHPTRPLSARGPLVFILLAVVAIGLVFGVILFSGNKNSNSGRDMFGRPYLWTEQEAKLTLVETPVVGRLNGRDFELTTAFWKDTQLTFEQAGEGPEKLELQITFPLRGGELVPGKTFRLGAGDAPFGTPMQVSWTDENGAVRRRSIASGYVLWITFDEVSKATVAGRIHLCLSGTNQSWVAGQFSAENRTWLN